MFDQLILLLKDIFAYIFGEKFSELTFGNFLWFAIWSTFLLFFQSFWKFMQSCWRAIDRKRNIDMYENFYGEWNYYRMNGTGQVNEIKVRISASFFQKSPIVEFDSGKKLSEKFRPGKLVMSDSAIYFVFGSGVGKLLNEEKVNYPFLIAMKKFIKPQKLSFGFALGQSIGNGKTYSAKIVFSKDRIDPNLLKDLLQKSSGFDDSSFKKLALLESQQTLSMQNTLPANTPTP